MTTAKIMVITAGLSQPSSSRLLADRLGAASVSALANRGIDVDLEVVELREWARDLANNLLTGFPSAPLGSLVKRLVDSNGLIAVTPIFSASYSGLFKMFFDVLEMDALSGKPTLIAATGGSARHSLALEHAVRPLFTYLRATVASTAVYAASQDWAAEDDWTGEELATRIDRAAEELAALVGQHVARPRPEALGQLVPFERLLSRKSS